LEAMYGILLVIGMIIYWVFPRISKLALKTTVLLEAFGARTKKVMSHSWGLLGKTLYAIMTLMGVIFLVLFLVFIVIALVGNT